MTKWIIVLLCALMTSTMLAQSALMTSTMLVQSDLIASVNELAEVEGDLIFSPLIVPDSVVERDRIIYPSNPFDWGITALGPMESDACEYACNELNGKVILPFEMQVAARSVQRELIRMGYHSDAIWVETGRGFEARPLPFDPEAKPLKLKRTLYQPMCLCSGAIISR